MSTVPPNSNDDDRDATPGAPDPSADQAAVPSTPPPDASSGSAGPADAPATPPAAEAAEARPTGSDVPEDELPGAASPPAPGAADEPGAEPAGEPPTAAPVAGPPVDGAAPTAPATQAFGPGEEPVTRQLPTEEEDEALRAERARRFGRVASSGAEPVEPGQTDPDPDSTAAGAGAAGAAVGTGTAAGDPAATGEPQPTTTMATDTTGEAAPPVEDDPFADFDEGPASRAAAHWWGILIAIVFGPVTWYLVADGGERISYSLSQNLEAVNVMGLVELGGGLITLVIMLMAARWSSVGSIIIGSIATLIGAAFLAVPQIVADFLTSQSMIFDRLGQFGTNVHDHLVSDGHSGRLLLYGITFIFIGVISHGARRQGRREERRKATLGV